MNDHIKEQLGKYRLVRLLGRGAFAEVYLGSHVLTGKHAAIKVLHTQLDSAAATEAFIIEARRISNLDHPHIVSILDFDVDEAAPFLVMTYAPLGTLRQRHPKGSPPTLSTVYSYVKQVADALSYAHGQGLIHCDIKPENILLKKEDEVLVSDFGIAEIAHATQSMPSPKEVVGTPAYMAPEQFRGRPHRASDQYALAVMVYEWLCGELPFSGPQFEAYAHQHQFIPPISLLEKQVPISKELNDVLMKGLAKEPKQRFASVKEFAGALEKSPPVLQPEHSSPWHALLSRRGFMIGGLVATSGITAYLVGSHLPSHQGGNIIPEPTSTLTPSTPASTNASSLTQLQPKLLVTYKGHTNEVDGLAWSPDNKRIVSGGRDWHTHVWDAASGNRVYMYQGHKDWVFAVGWSRTGQRVASGSSDDTIQVWDATTGGDPVTYDGHTAAVVALAWLPTEGKNIASASVDKTVQVWDVSSGVQSFSYTGHSAEVDAVCFSPDGMHAASGGVDQTVQVWNATNGTAIFTYNGHTAAVDTVAWSPNGKYIASGGVDHTVQVWDATTGTLLAKYQGHSDRVRCVAWSPDNTLLASASADATVQIWNVATQARLFVYRHKSWVHCVAWSQDGRLASGSADKTVQVWQMQQA